MLAALLCNLGQGRDADAGKGTETLEKTRKKRIILNNDAPLTVDDVLALADQLEAESDLKPVAQKVKKYVQKQTPEVAETSELLSILYVAQFEWREQAVQSSHDPHVGMILDYLSAILRFMQDEEEAILALILAQP